MNGKEKNGIKCPECGAQIDVEQVLFGQLEKKAEQAFKAKEKELEAELAARFAREKKAIETKPAEDAALRLKAMTEELERKSQEVKELFKVKAEAERIRREKDELAEKLKAESEARLNELLREQRKKDQQQHELKLAEMQHVIEQQKKDLADTQRRLTQGSMQVQGEVQEVAIEEYLRSSFPLDIIEEVKKGARGADCLHTINTRTRTGCGSIYVESKRTKEFSPSWIEKFKADMRAKGAGCGVLVTDVLPKGAERMVQMDGIWVCTMEEFKGLIHVLRESVILLDQAVSSQLNKADKMHVLYDYLVGTEFRQHIEAIVEGFVTMRSDLESEKRSMEALWKKREKQIQKVISNTSMMYGSLRGIAGIDQVGGLELPPPKEK